METDRVKVMWVKIEIEPCKGGEIVSESTGG